MCGIFGFYGASPRPAVIRDLAIKAGRRGPHACGWATGTPGDFKIARRSGSLRAYAAEIPLAPIIIGHSRLATTGSGSYRNLADAQPLTVPGTQEAAESVLVHNGIAHLDCGERLDTGNDSEALLRLVLARGFGEGLGALGAEPYAVLFAHPGGLEAAHAGLPLYQWSDTGGTYFCSVDFDGSRMESLR